MKYLSEDELGALLNEGRKDFEDIDLWGMDLSGRDLSYFSFEGSDLFCCDLRFSDLTEIGLLDTRLLKVKGLVFMGGIGSRNDTLYAWRKYSADRTTFEVIFRTGCFEGTEEEFRREINNKLASDQSYVMDAGIYRQ